MKKCVYLVGAGPGDVDLITVKGMSLLKKADVVVYDQLANPELLGYVPEDSERIYVGKKAGNHAMKQEDINRLLVDLSKSHDCVVRLKGGDPYVFGRGGEEGETLRQAGVPFEVVPGITSAIGGLAYAGIPITSRNVATSFHVMTGHVSENSEPMDYSALAGLNGTLVFLMGVGNLSKIVQGLLEGGKASQTPVAMIHRATTPYQTTITGTLETIVDLANENAIKPPSLIVVGDVINHREALCFFEEKPLFGKHILVTRAKAGQSKMSQQLTALGARVTQLPAITIKEQALDQIRGAIKDLSAYTGIIFTSGVAVSIFFREMRKLGYDGRHLYGLKMIVVGGETGKELKNQGIYPDYIPDTYTKEGVSQILEIIEEVSGDSGNYLVPRSARGDKDWIKELAGKYGIHEIKCYDTLDAEVMNLDMTSLGKVDYVTYTSASTVHGFMHQSRQEGNQVLKQIAEEAKLVVIGPATKKALESYGYKGDLQPETYTIKDMVEVIAKDAEESEV